MLTLSHQLVNSVYDVGFKTRIDKREVPVVLQSSTGVSIRASARLSSNS